MNILHTSDWHLGHRLHEQSQYDEQLLFLNWLIQTINQQHIDVLLLAGDVFDTGVPSTQSQKLYYDFLIQLRQTSCKQIIITGGNHDAPGGLNAPKALLEALSIHVVGKATDNVKDEVFELSVGTEKIIVAAVPYLRDQDIRRAISGESFEQIGDRYKAALVNHYNEIAEYCATIKTPETPVIAMGHLFALGGSTSESEQTIYVGNLGDIGAMDFPQLFDYIALGHLHRAQKVGNLNTIRYSGSPVMLSFSEVGAPKQVICIKTGQGKVTEVTDLEVPLFRELKRVSGNLDECMGQLVALHNQSHHLMPWVEVILDTSDKTNIGYVEISKAAENLNLEILKVTFKNDRKFSGLEKLIQNSKHIKELLPEDVFQLKCKEQNFSLDENPDVKDAFYEILQKVREAE